VNAERIRVWAARFAAPVAFFLAAIVLVLIVQSAIGSEGGETDTETTNQATAPATPPPPGAQAAGTTTAQGPQRRRFYRVHRGDTLELIAERFETDVERLLTLNPGIDPLGLTVGQRIRVR
jgi:LysM repeat protein